MKKRQAEGEAYMENDNNQPEVTMKKLRKINQYMKARAKFENTEWELSEELLMPFFNDGVRNFFGVELDEEGNLISDDQQPSFFMSYNSASIN